MSVELQTRYFRYLLVVNNHRKQIGDMVAWRTWSLGLAVISPISHDAQRGCQWALGPDLWGVSEHALCCSLDRTHNGAECLISEGSPLPTTPHGSPSASGWTLHVPPGGPRAQKGNETLIEMNENIMKLGDQQSEGTEKTLVQPY